MKIRPQNRNNELSEGLLEAARMVQNKSGEGETSPVPEPENVTDAEFTELKEPTPEEKRRAFFDRIWAGEGKPDPDATEVGVFELAAIELKDMGRQIREDVVKLGTNIRNGWIAAGNKAMTFYNAATIWAVAEIDTLKKSHAEFVRNAEAAAMWRKQERLALSPVRSIDFHESIDYLSQLWDEKIKQDKKENKEFNKRLDGIETAMRKLVRANNRAAATKQEAIDTLLENVLSGRLIAAVKAYSDLTGCDLADAKAKIEGFVPA